MIVSQPADDPSARQADSRVPGYLGRILNGDEPVGTCFQAGPGILLTAWHVLDDLAAGDVDATVRVDALAGGTQPFEAIVARIDPDHDLAVLTADSALPASVAGWAATDWVDIDTPVTVTGVVDVEDPGHTYDFLDAPGVWAGGTTRDGQIPLGRFTSTSVMKGMSGGPVRRRSDDRVVGVVSARYNSADGWGRDSVWVARTEDLQHQLTGITGISLSRWQGTTETAYLAEVRQIAPTDGLRGRDAELAELSVFCFGSERYMLCVAEPWAGKSALLSWFVLNAPDNVIVLCFFVNSRFAEQSDRAAFIEAIVNQLRALSHQPIEPNVASGNRETLRQHLLEQVCRHAERTNVRVVLVVDGLDEDQGIDTGPSIASLLPKNPGSALRVVVTSRANRPLPSDVPKDHPLRACTPRTLKSSPWARHIRDDARLELDRLLSGSKRDRLLLGLITVAGGLTEPELEELSDLAPYRIRALLHGPRGRVFQGRAAVGSPDDVILLAHETLQAESLQQLGNMRSREYREMIHSWADNYREKGWPADTPRYLLRGYQRMLENQQDISRLAVLALDENRHDRMLDLTGGDVQAFDEIRAVQDLIRIQEDPDLLTICKLRKHHEDLSRRNNRIPTALPAVWAVLGEGERAENLTLSVTDIERRRQILTRVAETLAPTDLDRAIQIAVDLTDADNRASTLTAVAQAIAATDPTSSGELLHRAEQLAGTITDAYHRELTLTAIARTLAATDPSSATRIANTISDYSSFRHDAMTAIAQTLATADPDRAVQIVNSIDIPGVRARAVTAIAQTLAATDPDRAVLLAESLTFASDRAEALAEVAVALAPIDPDRGQDLFDRAQQTAGTTSTARSGHESAEVLIKIMLANALAIVDPDRRQDLFQHAEQLARGITLSGPTGRVGVAIARAVATTDPDRAVQIADAISVPAARTEARAAIADALVATDPDRAIQIADPIADPGARTRAMMPIVHALAVTDLGRAIRVSDTITDPEHRAQALTEVAQALAITDPDRSRDLLHRAEELARSQATSDSDYQVQIRFTIVQAVAACDPDLAVEIAKTIPEPGYGDPAYRAVALATIVQAVAVSDSDRAIQIADTITDDPQNRAAALASVVRALATSDPDRAIQIADDSDDPFNRALTLMPVVEALATTDPDRAIQIAEAITDYPAYWAQALIMVARALAATDPDRAIGIAKGFTDPEDRAQALASVAQALASIDPGRAIRIANGLNGPEARAEVLLTIAETVASTDPDRAIRIADGLTNYPAVRALALTTAARTLAATDAGRSRAVLDRAEQLADTITHAESRARTLTTIAQTLAGTDPDRAIQIAGAIADPDPYDREHGVITVSLNAPGHYRAQALTLVAQAVATKDPDRAIRIADSLTDPEARTQALMIVAQTVGTTDPNRAIRIADTITNADQRAQVMTTVAKELAESGRLPDARRLLAQAWPLVAPWFSMLGVVESIDPGILPVIAREVLPSLG